MATPRAGINTISLMLLGVLGIALFSTLTMATLAQPAMADATFQENETEVQVEAEHEAGELMVRVESSAFPDGNETDESITVDVNGNTIKEPDGPDDTENGWKVYRVNLVNNDRVPKEDLSSATVTVTTANGETGSVSDLNLQYISLNDADVRFNDGNRLEIAVSESVGVTNETDIQLDANADEETAVLGGTYQTQDGASVIVDRNEAFRTLALQGEALAITGSLNALTLEGVSVDLRTPANDAGETIADGNTLEISHPLLFEKLEYVVTISTKRSGNEVVTTKRVTADDGFISVEHDGVVDETTSIKITYEDVNLGDTSELKFPAPLEVSLTDGNLSLDDDDRLQGKGELDVIISGEEQTTELTEVLYDNGTVRFAETDYEFESGEYTVVLDPVDGEPFAAQLIVGDGSNAAGGIEGWSPLGLGSMWESLNIFEKVGLTAGGILLILLTLFAGIWISGSGTEPSARSRMPEMSLDVNVVDSLTGQSVDDTLLVEFEPVQSGQNMHAPHETVTEQITGNGTVNLRKGRYKAKLSSGEEVSVSPNDSSVTIEIQSKSGALTVTSGATETSTPVSGATVALTRPDGDTEEKITGENGQITLEIPGTVDPADCTLEVEHDRYHTVETKLSGDVHLEPLTGDVSIRASLDGKPVSGVDVRLAPDDEHTQQISEPQTATTSEDGVTEFEALPVGNYETRIEFDEGKSVADTSANVAIIADELVTRKINASFTFEMEPTQQERIDELHRDITELTPSNRDGAIPYYYGSVLSKVLSAVDQFSESGVTFVQHGVDPGAAIDAVIDAVDAAINYTRRAMTNKQNVDLFTVCGGLRETRTKWTGEMSVDKLVAFVADEKANHRSEMIDRLEEIDSLLGEKRDAVSTVTPARAQYEQIREHATGLRGASPIEQRAHFFVGLRLLDAIEELFGHPELVDRLEETVF